MGDQQPLTALYKQTVPLDQDRAISLREGAPANFNMLGRLIGNAVPVLLGEHIGEILIEHVRNFGEIQN